MTACDAQGYARQRGRAELFRGSEYQTALLRKVALGDSRERRFSRPYDRDDSQCRPHRAEGTIGDGKIFVLPAERVIRIDDEKTGPEAV